MLVCVDVDGCLIDSDVPMLQALNDALESMSLKPVTLAEVRPHLGPPLLVTMERLLEAAGSDRGLAPELAERYRRAYETVSVTHVTVHLGMADALAALQAEGHDLAVVSSKPAAYSRPILHAAGLAELFDAVFGPEGEESEPKAWTLARARSRTGEPPTVMVGDTVYDIAAAWANRVPCIAVSWGYGDADDLAAKRPVALIDTADELVGAIETAATIAVCGDWQRPYGRSGKDVSGADRLIRFSDDELLVLHELIAGRLIRHGRVRGLTSFGVDQDAGVIRLWVHRDHDTDALASLLDGLPKEALQLEAADGGWYGFVPSDTNS